MSDHMPEGTEELSSALLKQGEAAFALGEYKESLAHLLEAFMLNNGNRDIQAAFIDILSHTSGFILPKPVTDLLANVAIENNHNAQSLAPVLASRFENDPAISDLIEFLEGTAPGHIVSIPDSIDIAAIINDPLFLLVCTKATTISPKIENLICVLRQHFLGEWLADSSTQSYFLDNHPEAVAAAACQNFNCEFIFPESEDETHRVDGLQKTILEDIRSAHPFELAILGCYRPLWQILRDGDPEKLQYLVDQSARWPGWVKLVWKVQFLAPFQETLIKQRLAVLSPIEEQLSQTIAQQYEAYPYPRWQSTNISKSKTSLAHHIEARFPQFDASLIPKDDIDILFAGCGTGEQIAKMASSFDFKNILAIDLSQNSLAYANRKIEELNFKNIHFGQADILAINSWDASFDLIVCTGVLHHMADPAEGLTALLSASKAHTLFFLALYSERGRAQVVATREFITDNAIPDSLEGMRQFREQVRQLPADHPVKAISDSRDFYSASGLHDYVFNTHEVRYTPKELKALLDSQNLEFLGFDIARGDHKTAFKKRFPNDPAMLDLDNWDQFEKDVPEVFEKMMQFWCAKKNEHH